MVVFLFEYLGLPQRGGVPPATPPPSIISQKIRNNCQKLVKYWPMSKTLKIHYANAGPMRPICRSVSIVPVGTSLLALPVRSTGQS